MKRIRPPFKYYGGKYYLSKWIIPLFPNHQTYVEPFGGAASILLNKPKSEIEIYNDLNQGISNLMTYIRDNLPELMSSLKKIECKENVFYHWKEKECKNNLEHALKAFVIYRMSRGGSGLTFSKSSRYYRGVPENVSAWNSSIDNLELVSDRLQSVEIHSKDATQFLNEFDESTLFYLDPPYVSSSRRSFSKENKRFDLSSIYKIEMEDKEHESLLKKCLKSKSQILISGYKTELYQEMLSSWNSISIETYLHSSQSKKKSKAEEILWANFTLLEHASCTTKSSCD